MCDTREYSEVRIAVPWGHIAGRWYGDQTVRPLLALHGWMDNCGTFARLAPLLLPTAGSVLCVDLPGHGLSTHLPAGMSYRLEFMRSILRIMQAYKWAKVSLLAHSMGGDSAFHFAALYPQRVDVLIGIDILNRKHIVPEQEIAMLNYTLERTLLDDARALQRNAATEPPSYTFAQCEQLLYEGTQHAVNLENCKYLLERSLTRSPMYPRRYYFARDARLKHFVEFNPDVPLARAMAKRMCAARMPHLVVKGGASNNINVHARQVDDVMQSHNPNFKEHVVPGGSHYVHLNDPLPVAELVNAFLLKYRPLETLKAEVKGKL